MAGAGYKLFNTGDVLTAAQVNTYLQEQTVMVFANSAARTTALAGVLAEGMVTYLKDTNAIEKYTGAAWVNIDSGSTSPLTTKGDIYTYSTTDARLAVGSNGDTLVADSSTTTGLRWQADWNTGKNKIINGDFGIWQRGTSFSIATNSLYATDRFYAVYSTAAPTSWTVSQQAFTAGTAPVSGYEASFFLRSEVATLGSATAMSIRQRIEDVRTLAGQTATFSFWAKADSNRTISATVIQEFGSGGSSAVTALNANVNITTTWARYSITGTIPSISGKTLGSNNSLQVRIAHPVEASTIDTWGWQLEAGSVATPFTTATGTLAGELAAAMRYYQRYSQTALTAQLIPNAGAVSTTVVDFGFPTQVPFRIKPGSLETVNVGVYQFSNATTYSNGTWSIANDYSAQNIPLLRYTHGSAVFTANNVCGLVTTSASNLGYIGLSAEL